MSQIEIACPDLVFHFNKKHLTDPTIPMWVIKAKGETYYVNHVSADMPWSTKETPNNDSTKGSIKFKKCHLIIDDNNEATIKPLTMLNAARLKKTEPKRIRLIMDYRKHIDEFIEYCNEQGIQHDDVHILPGSCGSRFYATEIKEDDLLLLRMWFPPKMFRELMPNEYLYGYYDKHAAGVEPPDYDEYDYDDDEDDDTDSVTSLEDLYEN